MPATTMVRAAGHLRRILAGARAVSPSELGQLTVSDGVLCELEAAHRSMIELHLEKGLKSVRVLREIRRTH